jgi:hypothetical protein
MINLRGLLKNRKSRIVLIIYNSVCDVYETRNKTLNSTEARMRIT